MEIVDDDGTLQGDPSQDLSSGYIGRKPQEPTPDEQQETEA